MRLAAVGSIRDAAGLTTRQIGIVEACLGRGGAGSEGLADCLQRLALDGCGLVDLLCVATSAGALPTPPDPSSGTPSSDPSATYPATRLVEAAFAAALAGQGSNPGPVGPSNGIDGSWEGSQEGFDAERTRFEGLAAALEDPLRAETGADLTGLPAEEILRVAAVCREAVWTGLSAAATGGADGAEQAPLLELLLSLVGGGGSGVAPRGGSPGKEVSRGGSSGRWGSWTPPAGGSMEAARKALLLRRTATLVAPLLGAEAGGVEAEDVADSAAAERLFFKILEAADGVLPQLQALVRLLSEVWEDGHALEAPLVRSSSKAGL